MLELPQAIRCSLSLHRGGRIEALGDGVADRRGTPLGEQSDQFFLVRDERVDLPPSPDPRTRLWHAVRPGAEGSSATAKAKLG
jgi:hypothetical protein